MCFGEASVQATQTCWEEVASARKAAQVGEQRNISMLANWLDNVRTLVVMSYIDSYVCSYYVRQTLFEEFRDAWHAQTVTQKRSASGPCWHAAAPAQLPACSAAAAQPNAASAPPSPSPRCWACWQQLPPCLPREHCPCLHLLQGQCRCRSHLHAHGKHMHRLFPGLCGLNKQMKAHSMRAHCLVPGRCHFSATCMYTFNSHTA